MMVTVLLNSLVETSGIRKMDMSFGGRGGIDNELLNNSSYKIQRTCMESYIDKESQMVIRGNNWIAPTEM